MKPLKNALIIIAAFLALFAFSGVALADVGNFNDYGGDGGWDFGGTDFGSDYDDFDDDYSGFGDSAHYGSGYYGNSSGGDEDDAVGLIFAIIFIGVVAFIVPALRRRGRRGGSSSNYPVLPSDNTALITDVIRQDDKDFSPEKFLAWAKEVFITLQQAWTERKWESVRPFEKEELFRQHEMQLKEYINAGRINVIERININQAYLSNYTRDKDYEYLTVYMQVRMTDYIIDEKTRQVLKGDPNKDSYLQYLLKFMRKNGVKTDPINGNRSTVACPHCGAPTNITSSGKCEYCGFIITTGEFDWVLADITGIKPGTVIETRPIVIEDEESQDNNNPSGN